MRASLQIAGGGAMIFVLACLGAAPAQDVREPAQPDGVEVLTRGPVHEAFAQPSDVKPEPGRVVPKEPPPPVPEEPPDERPEGANVQFILGYWAWDDDENRFLWVSGGYRNAPMGRQWVPGHWVRSDEGWRWVPGMWAAEQQQELRYTPEPPAPLQVEPSIAPQDDSSSWVAGTWVYRDTRFVWRPGYWSPFRVGRVWVGARYNWTPSGYLFCDGYWDYPWEDRGVLFAPVYFHRPYWHTSGWFYRPWHVVNFGLFYDSCFTHRGSFYFGNYYGSRYAGYGYRPWYYGHGRYDSAFNYHRWHNGHDRNWYGQQRQLYADRNAGRAPVPPRNFAQQQQFANSKGPVSNNFARAVTPLNQVKTVNKNVNLVRMSPAQAETQKALIKRSQDVSQIRNQAAGAKVSGVNAKAPNKAENATPIKLPPLVRGTEAVRSNDGPTNKVGNNGGNSGSPKKTFNLPSSNDSGKKTSGNAAVNNAPKVTFPNPGKAEVRSNVGDNRPAPNVNKGPAPKVQGGGNAPKLQDFKNSPPPKTNIAPPSNKSTAPAPRVFDAPRSTPAPRSFESPKSSPSVPKFSSPAPRVAPSAPAPRMSSPSVAPRSVPQSAPRFSAPSSAPRMSSSPAPRSSPSNAPRGGGGGKGKG